MESLKIKSNLIKLAINEDESRVIEINPSDPGERKKIITMVDFINKEISKNKKKIEENSKNDDDMSAIESLNLTEELFNSIASKIDEVYGEDTSKKITEGQKDIMMLVQFCEGITPYYAKYQNEIINKYSNNKKNNNKKVMK